MTDAIPRTLALVDPARCRIWPGHNRDYAALDEAACADLLDSFRTQGRQEVAAIVRPAGDDAAHDYEVVCGARRHWSASWLRAHGNPDFGFLIEPRALTDEEAFRLADLENRSRRDLSDYERATDYARAIARYYDGSQRRMAERLKLSPGWLSRSLELAKLPDGIVAAFGSPHDIRVKHAATLAPLLHLPRTRAPLLAEAELLALEQALLRERRRPLPAGTVLRRLLAAASVVVPKPRVLTVREPDGPILARGARPKGAPLTIRIPTLGMGNRDAVLEAVRAILDHFTDRTMPRPPVADGTDPPSE